MNKRNATIAWVGAALLLALVLLLNAKPPSDKPADGEEISRVKSPDGVVDAVTMRSNGSATVSYSYEVYIVPSGANPSAGYEIFTADHTENMSLTWSRSKLLNIHYKHARIFRFTNFWEDQKVQNFNYVVEVHLVPANPGSSLMDRDR